MVSKKTYLFVLVAILNACTPTNQITILPSSNPITSPSPTVITSSVTPVSTPNPTSTPLITTVTSSTPTPIMTTVSTPFPTVMPTATAKPNLSILSVDELKKINDSSIVKSNNTFGINLYKDIVKEQKVENVFISPASLALALQMTYNGAELNTKDEMTKTLELGNLDLDQVNNLSKLLIKKLNSPAPDIQLQVANSLWGGKGRISFLKDFKDNLTNYYNAESSELDFNDKKSVETINAWASKNTNGKIPKVIEEIKPNIIAFIMNAVYFKANWTTKFDVKQTEKRDFTLSDGSKKMVSMISDFRSFRYYKNNFQDTPNDLKFEAAELSYGKDSKVSLYMFLPSTDSSLEKFYSQLNEDNLEKWLKGFYNSDGYISFPKFKNEWKKELKDNLKNIGMKQAFAEFGAQFKKMGTTPFENIYIDFVLHNTFVDVNEEGTEAAAVTTVGVGGAASSAPTPRFVADRPFFYMIRDNETKSILFMGSVNDPKYD